MLINEWGYGCSWWYALYYPYDILTFKKSKKFLSPTGDYIQGKEPNQTKTNQNKNLALSPSSCVTLLFFGFFNYEMSVLLWSCFAD